jgi:outer membrane protein
MVKGTVAVLVVMSSLLAGTTAFAETLTLREAIGRALKSNHLLQAAGLERRAAEEDVAVSRSRYLPTLSLQSGANLTTTPSRVFMMKLDEARINPETDFSRQTLNHPNPRGDFNTSLTLEQPLLDFGISTDAKIAGKNAESAALSLEARREETAFRVYLSYLQIRKAKAYADIADQAVADAKEHKRLAALRERDGIGLKSDELRAATELSEAEQRAVTAKNDLLLARMRLNLVIGGRAGDAVDITEIPALSGPSSDVNLAPVAQVTRPELKIAQKTLEKGELGVRRAEVAYLPTIYGQASYQINDRDVPLGWDNDSWTVGVGLRWELFDGNRRRHEKNKAEFARDAAAALLEEERKEVALQVAESNLRRQEAGLKIDSARAALKAAEESMRLISLRFQNGLSTMVEVLDAESALNRCRANVVELENGLLAATGDVYYQSGIFLKEVMR